MVISLGYFPQPIPLFPSTTLPESATIYEPPLTLMRVLFDYIADKFGGLGSLLDVRTVGYCSVVEAGLGVLLV